MNLIFIKPLDLSTRLQEKEGLEEHVWRERKRSKALLEYNQQNLECGRQMTKFLQQINGKGKRETEILQAKKKVLKHINKM